MIENIQITLLDALFSKINNKYLTHDDIKGCFAKNFYWRPKF